MLCLLVGSSIGFLRRHTPSRGGQQKTAAGSQVETRASASAASAASPHLEPRELRLERLELRRDGAVEVGAAREQLALALELAAGLGRLVDVLTC